MSERGLQEEREALRRLQNQPGRRRILGYFDIPAKAGRRLMSLTG